MKIDTPTSRLTRLKKQRNGLNTQIAELEATLGIIEPAQNKRPIDTLYERFIKNPNRSVAIDDIVPMGTRRESMMHRLRHRHRLNIVTVRDGNRRTGLPGLFMYKT